MFTSPSLWGIVKKHNKLKKISFTFLYLHLYMYIKCMDIYLDILDFHVLDGKCKNFYWVRRFSTMRQGDR